MLVIEGRNVHVVLPKALVLLEQYGEARDSRNGPVRVAPWSVATVYQRPWERVIFWPQRDANPAFAVFESLWMLAGRRDLAPLLRYVKDFGRFSDDGRTLHGAYGYRWRKQFGMDQLQVIAERLARDPTDRRCVLQMWDAPNDLGHHGNDVPCNDVATFQINPSGALDLTVFCRSNDIILGAYGANAVHFSVLHEYMAMWIGVPPGSYTQVSVNWHAYLDTLQKLDGLTKAAFPGMFGEVTPIPDPYTAGEVHATIFWPRNHKLDATLGQEAVEEFDRRVEELLLHAETGFALPRETNDDWPWFEVAWAVLRAHHCWRTLPAPERYQQALAALHGADPKADWIVAMREWITRRSRTWEAKQDPQALSV